MNQNMFWFFVAAYNIATDIYILLVPIPELLKLNLSFRKKLMLIAIFSTGFMYVSCPPSLKLHT